MTGKQDRENDQHDNTPGIQGKLDGGQEGVSQHKIKCRRCDKHEQKKYGRSQDPPACYGQYRENDDDTGKQIEHQYIHTIPLFLWLTLSRAD
jgi:hypothetical protein